MKNDNQVWQNSAAKWISMESCQTVSNLYLDFARRFTLDSKQPLSLKITAVSQYIVWINGRYLDRGPAMSYQGLYYYDRLDVPADDLNEGENLITVCLHHDGKDTETIQGFEYGSPGLLCELSAADAILVSDKQWKVRQSPVYSGQSMVSKWGTYKEFYHGDREDNWKHSGFDYTSWQNAVEVADPVSKDFVQNLAQNDLLRLEKTTHQPLHIVTADHSLARVSLDLNELPVEYTASHITVQKGPHYAAPSITYDFGEMKVGYPQIQINGGFCIYEVWYGESLDMYRLDVVRNPGHGFWKAFQRRAFRFLMIKFIALQSDVTVESVSIENTWYAYNTAGQTHCSDPQINRILDVSKYTLRANTSYHYEDCPWREQALWIFDMRVMALINYYFFGNPEIVAKNLRQAFALQNPDGSLNSTGPKRNTCFHLDFCMHLVSTLREYHDYCADLETVKDLLPYVEKLHAFILSFKDRDDILDSGPVGKYGAPFLDWSDRIDKLGKSIILNAVFNRYLEDIEKLYSLAGKPVEEFQKIRQNNTQAVNSLLCDPDTGLYRDSFFENKLSQNTSMQGNMAAIYGRFVPKEKIPALLEKISDPEKFPPPYAPSFYLIIFDALHHAQRPDLIMGHIKRYWGAMLDRDARTWWEVFNPDSPEWVYPHPFLGNVPTYEMDWIPVSTCHGWSGAAAYAIPRYLLGIDLTSLAQNKITIAPPAKNVFDAFTYHLPIKQDMLKLEFTNTPDEKVKILHKPDSIDIQIIKQD